MLNLIFFLMLHTKYILRAMMQLACSIELKIKTKYLLIYFSSMIRSLRADVATWGHHARWTSDCLTTSTIGIPGNFAIYTSNIAISYMFAWISETWMPPISPFISGRCKNCTLRRSISNPATKTDRNCSLISTTFNKSSLIIYTSLTPSGSKQKISRKPELQIPPLPTYLPGECKSTMPICWIYKTLPLREWPCNQSLLRKPRR